VTKIGFDPQLLNKQNNNKLNRMIWRKSPSSGEAGLVRWGGPGFWWLSCVSCLVIVFRGPWGRRYLPPSGDHQQWEILDSPLGLEGPVYFSR
jgi:hypothetical protein